MFSKKPVPIPVTLGDCLLLSQMGYEVEINDGRFVNVSKRKWGAIRKKKELQPC